jgi:probable FeS assembly SUF system protein SufT
MSSHDLPIALKRDVSAIQIPAGVSVTLSAGGQVQITQSLGGTFTVAMVGQTGLYRIQGKDADALGLEKPAESSDGTAGEVSEEQIWEKLKTCYDPEIPVNIVDLGLVYSLEILPAAQGKRVEVKMTLTAQGCGMGPSIAADAREKILTLSAVSEADVQVVWQPPWNPSMISADGKKRLGMS